jgi:hypothetical protein
MLRRSTCLDLPPQAELNDYLAIHGGTYLGRAGFLVMMLIVLGIILGAALGLRFTVLVLFPATLLSFALIASVAAARGYGLWPTLIAVALSITGIQVGFLGAISTRYFMTARRSAHLRGAADRPTAAARGSAR